MRPNSPRSAPGRPVTFALSPQPYAESPTLSVLSGFIAPLPCGGGLPHTAVSGKTFSPLSDIPYFTSFFSLVMLPRPVLGQGSRVGWGWEGVLRAGISAPIDASKRTRVAVEREA